MIPLDGDFVLDIAPKVRGKKAEDQARIVGTISGVLAATLEEYEISTRLRVAHFMAQVAHESDGFCTTEEYASGADYEGREDLGNTEEGDGKRYKGRGLLQLTGRDNYRRYGEFLRLPLEAQPEIAADPVTSLRIACEFWKFHSINALCDRDDLVKVTEIVNGGRRGLKERRQYLQKAKVALSRIEAVGVSIRESQLTVVLHRGSFGDAVGELQQLLVSRGYRISIDNDFGPATELAVKLFQEKSGLTVDGIVGKNTWQSLLT